ncbi:hypothetical protein Hanom_Chr16g01479631 [Helianthus anomalus]
MPSSYPGRHMPLPRLESGTSGKRWMSVANWATQLVSSNNSISNNIGVAVTIVLTVMCT